MAAEIFPTRYRATGYGIAFASGTVGSIFAQIVPDTLKANSLKTRAVFLLVSSGYLVGAAAFAWAWLPDVQLHRRSELAWGHNIYPLESRTLESLAEGRKGAEDIPPPRFGNRFWAFRRR